MPSRDPSPAARPYPHGPARPGSFDATPGQRSARPSVGWNAGPDLERGNAQAHQRPLTPQTASPSIAPTAHTRPFDARDALGVERQVTGPRDPRTNRPGNDGIPTHPDAGGPPANVTYYNNYYYGWYCHPWYRHTYWTSSVVWFGFGVYPWTYSWIPPYRYGWAWTPGYWYWGWWHPGYWRPLAPVPVGYVYVPGWWEYDTVYVEGYYRKKTRDEWRWVDGRYLEDGTYVRGHWIPTGPAPAGYTWVPGFWNGEEWYEGFWRPEYRSGYRWLDGYYDESGTFYAGYWEPTEDRPGYVWVPGWFDGTGWVNGEWIPEGQLDAQDPGRWVPEEGLDEVVPVELEDDAPLALPVTPSEDEGETAKPAPDSDDRVRAPR